MSVNDKLYNAITLLNSLLETKSFKDKIIISDELQLEACDKAVKHLFFHNNIFRIDGSNTDIYKLLSWYGFYLSKIADDKHGIIYLATLNILNNKILFNEKCKRKISNNLMTKIYQMLVFDEEDDNIAIGKNGLYISFRTARDICITQNTP